MKVGNNQPSIKEQMAKSSQGVVPTKRDRPAERAAQPVQLTTMSNGPSKGPPVTLGQSNRSPYTPLENTKGGCGGQVEHPWLKRVPEGDDESGGDMDSGGPCHLYGGGAPHHQINTRARGHTVKGGQLIENLSCENQSQNELNVEIQKPRNKEKLEQRSEKVRDMAVEIVHRSHELDQVSVAQLQSGDTLVSEEMVADSLAKSKNVCDAALAPGHDMCGAALVYERCENILAPGRELRSNIQTGDCEEKVSVDQLPVLNDIQRAQDNDVTVQIGQNVESKAYLTEDIRRKKVLKVFSIFNSKLDTDKLNQKHDNPRGMLKPKLLLTPSKIRKLSIDNFESSTSTNSSEMKIVDTLQGEMLESPAKRRRYCGNGQGQQNGSQ